MKIIKKTYILIAMLLVIATGILSLEIRPFSVAYSSVFTTSNQTEIKMHVLVNTLFDVDEEELAKEVITEHQNINGIRKNTEYTLILYRTGIHYRRNWEYDTIICDENGAIICCGDDCNL